MIRFVTVKEMYEDKREELKLEVISGGKKGLSRRIKVFLINRPGLALANYFDYFAYGRVQILGKTEFSYLKKLSRPERDEILKKLCSYNIPCIVITRKMRVPHDLLAAAQKKDIPILRTPLMTNKFINKISFYLEDKFAPSTSLHGVLIDIYGVGVLILGESGIGKSECALELVKRGHRLVTDDVVEITRKPDGVLMGCGVEFAKHHMEVRGLGIIDIKNLFGTGAIRDFSAIDVVINLEGWDSTKEYDRLGFEEHKFNILGIDLPQHIIPVGPGRNVAIIAEVAAMNWRLKAKGYNSAVEFNKRLITVMGRKKKQG
ncbi:MAG: HPr(Ser) kinase/phosphatase [bacterium]